MPPTARTPRDRWIQAGLDALARGGPDAVRVETLAAELGVTKGGFYGYFAGRPALLAELLDEWERRCTDDVLARVEAEGGDPVEKLRRAGELTFSDELHRIDLAVRQWARRDPEVAERLRRIDNVRMGFLRSMFASFIADPDEVEARCALMFALAIGRHFVAADHPGRTDREYARMAGEFLLRP
ncbi:TetR/AcrR family transcriptional regulator [Nocardiopsis sp. N85]|uniref:TetR/AcrR family transcriptional regulator n=1 Tax=Nocardiopsis sp. N85 TaxID=3029400 RepID=UPI00237FB72A|nr:TetR/AcrR family transcriptional regulator [Nocardiopsis sp. N85]MDE3725035.1 TetR/AcrR family transcriptional regulator [Nocardiopsis sp. N85]